MNLIEQLNQNPLVAIIVVLVPVVGTVWKVFHALYVKPRDFKITSLTDNLEELKDEIIRLRREQEREVAQPAPEKPTTTASLPPRTNDETTDGVARILIAKGKGSPLSSLAACYFQWSDDSLTKLQKQKFEEDYIGKQVSWKVQVDSVSDVKFENIYVSLTEPTDDWNRPHAHAVFPESAQSELLSLNTGDWIVLRGVISRFFLCPEVDHCQIERVREAEPEH